MRVMVVGATGTIGGAVVDALAGHEVLRTSRRGPVPMDLADPVLVLPPELDELDAVVCCAANAPMAPLHGSSDAEFFGGSPASFSGRCGWCGRSPRACATADRSR